MIRRYYGLTISKSNNLVLTRRKTGSFENHLLHKFLIHWVTFHHKCTTISLVTIFCPLPTFSELMFFPFSFLSILTPWKSISSKIHRCHSVFLLQVSKIIADDSLNAFHNYIARLWSLCTKYLHYTIFQYYLHMIIFMAQF